MIFGKNRCFPLVFSGVIFVIGVDKGYNQAIQLSAGILIDYCLLVAKFVGKMDRQIMSSWYASDF